MRSGLGGAVAPRAHAPRKCARFGYPNRNRTFLQPNRRQGADGVHEGECGQRGHCRRHCADEARVPGEDPASETGTAAGISCERDETHGPGALTRARRSNGTQGKLSLAGEHTYTFSIFDRHDNLPIASGSVPATTGATLPQSAWSPASQYSGTSHAPSFAYSHGSGPSTHVVLAQSTAQLHSHEPTAIESTLLAEPIGGAVRVGWGKALSEADGADSPALADGGAVAFAAHMQ